MVAVVVVDNKDGTGTATITGSAGGATNTVYRGLVNVLSNIVPTWTSAGTRVGDGAVTVTLANGYYWFYVSEDTPAVSSPYYSRISDGADAILWGIMEGLQSRIQSLTFAAVGTDNQPTIKNRNIDILKNFSAVKSQQFKDYPGILISPANKEVRDPYAGNNLKDDVNYSVLVQIVDKDRERSPNVRGLRTYLKWREQICRSIQNQDLPGIDCTEVWVAYAEPGDVIDKEILELHQFYVSGIICRFKSRESRGLT